MTTKAPPHALSASSMIGDRVVDGSGRALGRLYDLMIDLETGCVAYAVLSFGGFMGVGDKLFAIPWHMLALDPDHRRFVLDIDRERLKNAPGFDKNHWPDTTSRELARRIHAHYGVEPGER